MRRREFIKAIGGSVVAWPAMAQQRERRIGILAGGLEDNTTRANLTALREELAKLGWIEGHNLRIDLRVNLSDLDRIRAHAVELISLTPDVIIASSRPATKVVQDLTKTIPIVFTAGDDPITGGLLQNIARPEGNTTGFTSTVDSLSGKWLELLKEAAPHITRVALVFNPQTVNINYFRSIEAAASLIAVQAIRTPALDPLETVRVIDAFAVEPNSGLLVVPVFPADSYHMFHRVAAQHRLPGIHSNRSGVAAGGLMTYTADLPDLNRRAAAYVDRLLRGAKVSELPVQFPTKFELVINLKAAKAIGLDIPATLLARADELIQ